MVSDPAQDVGGQSYRPVPEVGQHIEEHQLFHKPVSLPISGSPRQQTFFRFFDLPPELRNLVYEHHAGASTAYLVDGNLTDYSNLLKASPELSAEYRYFLFIHAPIIKIRIKHFDFSRVINFINSLFDAELDTLPSVGKPCKRQIILSMIFSRPGTQNNVDMLKQWLNRVGDPEERGYRINFSYRRTIIGWVGMGPTNPALDHTKRDWSPILEEYAAKAASPRAAEEAKKIKATLPQI